MRQQKKQSQGVRSNQRNGGNSTGFLSKLFLLIIIIMISKGILFRALLKNYGEKTKGVVTEVKGVGSKGTVRTNFTFYIDKRYENSTNNLNVVAIGDTISITFLPTYPNISEATDALKGW